MNYMNRALQYYQGDKAEPWDQPCAARPSPDHVFTGTISLDPVIMWRTKTPAEVDAEKTARVEADFVAALALRALVDIVYPLLPDPKPTKAAVLSAIKARYKELLA